MKNILKIFFAVLVAIIIFFLGESSVKQKSDSNVPLRAKGDRKRSPKNIELPRIEFTMPVLNSLNSLTIDILGLSKQLTEIERNRLVSQLSSSVLSKDDFQAFYTFLNSSPGNNSSYLALHSLKNDLLTFLIQDGRYKDTTGKLMLEIIKDKNQHNVMKEYTLQYMSDYFFRHWLVKSDRKGLTEKRVISEIDQQLQLEMVQTMFTQLKSPENPISGTALIRLNDISKVFSIIDKKQIVFHTEQIIRNSSSSISSKMAALTVTNEKQLSHLQNEIKYIAFDQSNSVILRMAALNTAGSLMQSNEFKILLQKNILSNMNEDKRILYAAKEIYKRLNKTKG